MGLLSESGESISYKAPQVVTVNPPTRMIDGERIRSWISSCVVGDDSPGLDICLPNAKNQHGWHYLHQRTYVSAGFVNENGLPKWVEDIRDQKGGMLWIRLSAVHTWSPSMRYDFVGVFVSLLSCNKWNSCLRKPKCGSLPSKIIWWVHCSSAPIIRSKITKNHRMTGWHTRVAKNVHKRHQTLQ